MNYFCKNSNCEEIKIGTPNPPQIDCYSKFNSFPVVSSNVFKQTKKKPLPSLNAVQVPPSCGMSLSSSLQKLDTAMWQLPFGKWSIIRMFKVEDPWCVLRKSVTNRDERSLGGKSQGFLHPTLEHILPHILPTSTTRSWVTCWEYNWE